MSYTPIYNSHIIIVVYINKMQYTYKYINTNKVYKNIYFLYIYTNIFTLQNKNVYINIQRNPADCQNLCIEALLLYIDPWLWQLTFDDLFPKQSFSL